MAPSTSLGASSVTFAAGSTTAQTTTMTAVNNFTDAANNAIALTLTADSPWVTIGAAPTVTINDDDELTKPTGVKLSVDGTKIRVDWTAGHRRDGLQGAVEQHLQRRPGPAPRRARCPAAARPPTPSTPRRPSPPTPATTSASCPPRPAPTSRPPTWVDTTTHATSANATVDYDADNDGLIEVSNLAQLNAVRWDLDGNGVGGRRHKPVEL